MVIAERASPLITRIVPQKANGTRSCLAESPPRQLYTDIFRLPIGVIRDESRFVIRLAEASADRFSDPFFEETVGRLAETEKRDVMIVRRDNLNSNPSEALLSPAGLIFHMSRCGSTLVSQLLRQSKPCVVFSEPTAVNDVLMPPWNDWNEEEIIAALRLVVQMLGISAGGCPFVLKLRSWNSLFADLILRAFPAVPWIAVVRDPLEVAVSVLRKPPTWLRTFDSSKNPFLGLPDVDMNGQEPREQYVAGMLGSFLRHLFHLPTANGQVIDYTELPSAVWSKVAPHISLSLHASEINKMKNQAGLYSKDRQQLTPFSPDTQGKREAASDLLRRAVEERAMPMWRALLNRTQT